MGDQGQTHSGDASIDCIRSGGAEARDGPDCPALVQRALDAQHIDRTYGGCSQEANDDSPKEKNKIHMPPLGVKIWALQ